MDPKESGAAGEDSARPEPAAKVPLTPRKAAMPTSSGELADPGLQLSPTSKEAAWERKNRIRPKSPKIPFDHPSKITEAPPGIPQKSASLPRHVPRRGLLAFFLNRRKGRSRVWNLILLPAAVVIAFLVILFLFKFH
jgi:hypothetical protein